MGLAPGRVVLQKLVLPVQVAGVTRSPARGGVPAADRPAPFEEQHVDAGQPGVPPVAAGEVVACLVQVPVGLEENDIVPGGGKSVDEAARWLRPPSGVSVIPGPRNPQKL